MKQSSLICLLFLSISFVSNGLAQSANGRNKTDHPNLSGRWKLNISKSTGGTMFMFAKSGRDSKCSSYILIEHADPKLVVREKVECLIPEKPTELQLVENTVATYFTDERGEAVTAEMETVESRTKWNGDKIQTSIFKSDSKTGKKNITRIVELKLSRDGKTLTVKSDAADTFGTSDLNVVIGADRFNKLSLVYDLLN